MSNFAFYNRSYSLATRNPSDARRTKNSKRSVPFVRRKDSARVVRKIKRLHFFKRLQIRRLRLFKLYKKQNQRKVYKWRYSFRTKTVNNVNNVLFTRYTDTGFCRSALCETYDYAKRTWHPKCITIEDHRQPRRLKVTTDLNKNGTRSYPGSLLIVSVFETLRSCVWTGRELLLNVTNQKNIWPWKERMGRGKNNVANEVRTNAHGGGGGCGRNPGILRVLG